MQNILFIMCDQLRWDYLSCYGHPHLETPHIDSLAARGVRFDRAYCQSPLCGPSRMSFYTGRYVTSHGSQWNSDPLPLDELTLGDYLRPMGMRTALVGKTHFRADQVGMTQLGIDPASERGIWLSQCGFEPFERDDGLHPDKIVRPNLAYNQWLREKGYQNDNPWQQNANSSIDKDGTLHNGWHLSSGVYPANIDAPHSETPYMTDRAIDFIEAAGSQPWCLHLSYIKPHWPYIAPAPYHDLYSSDQMLPVVKNQNEREEAHPVFEAFMQQDYSRTFAREDVRQAVIPAYMGLIKQIDDEIGRLLTFLDERNLTDNTVIVFTSDHGDYLGDHWLGEKDLFHEPSVRIPLIIADPSQSAESTRGTTRSELVEAIDLVPTFLELAGGPTQPQRLEGRSLLPLLHAQDSIEWRDFTISEIDYSGRDAMHILRLEPEACRAWMLRTERWKFILHHQFRPQLFDMTNDPDEFVDLGDDPAYETIRRELQAQLFVWFRERKQRTTVVRDDVVRNAGSRGDAAAGIFIGRW